MGDIAMANLDSLSRAYAERQGVVLEPIISPLQSAHENETSATSLLSASRHDNGCSALHTTRGVEDASRSMVVRLRKGSSSAAEAVVRQWKHVCRRVAPKEWGKRAETQTKANEKARSFVEDFSRFVSIQTVPTVGRRSATPSEEHVRRRLLGLSPSLTSPAPSPVPPTLNNLLGDLVKQLDASFKAGCSSGDTTSHAEGSNPQLTSPVSTQDPDLLVPAQLRDVLFPFQREGVAWLFTATHDPQSSHGCILADEMGLGKTVQVLALLATVFAKEHVKGPHLIVAPLSTLSHWREHVEMFLSGFRVVVLHGNTREATAKQVFVGGSSSRNTPTSSVGCQADIVICDHSLIARLQSAPAAVRKLMHVQWRYLLLDEAHRIKSSRSVLFMLLGQFLSTSNIAITGTPIQNDLSELWTLLTFVAPATFRTDPASKHLMKYFQKAAAHEEFIRQLEVLNVSQRLHELLSHLMLRREKQDVQLQLPQIEDFTISCPVSRMQRDQIAQILHRTTQQHTQLALRQTLLHPYLHLEQFVVSESVITDSGKFLALDIILQFLVSISCKPSKDAQQNAAANEEEEDLLDVFRAAPPAPAPTTCAASHKALIFCAWTHVLDLVEVHLKLRGWGFRRLDGATSLENRELAIRDFTDDPDYAIPFFLISKGAGGVGLNLQVADTVIFLDADYNPQRDLQALSRVHRVGQKRAVRVFRLTTTSSVEMRVAGIADAKRKLERHVNRVRCCEDAPSDEMETSSTRKISLHESNSSFTEECISLEAQLRRCLPRAAEEADALEKVLASHRTRYEEGDKTHDDAVNITIVPPAAANGEVSSDEGEESDASSVSEEGAVTAGSQSADTLLSPVKVRLRPQTVSPPPALVAVLSESKNESVSSPVDQRVRLKRKRDDI